MQVDPIEGGTENSYVYPGDPVNGWDLDGRATRNYSLCASLIVAGCLGLVFDDSSISYTASGGVGTPGLGPSVTYGKGQTTLGWAMNTSASYGAAVSANSGKRGNSIEYGIARPGLSIGAQYTARLTKCTFGIGKCGKGKQTHKQTTKFIDNIKNGKLKKNNNKSNQRKRR